MSKVLLRFIQDESGATAIEYALLAAGIAMSIVVSMSVVSCSLNNLFSDIAGLLKTN